MTRYLVTGGAGFIGSHVVDALAARGAVVRVVDDLSTGAADHLVGHPAVELIEANLADRQVAEAAVAGVDYAIHLAASPSVPRSVTEPRHAHRANVEATHELLLAARGGGVRRVGAGELVGSVWRVGDVAAPRGAPKSFPIQK